MKRVVVRILLAMFMMALLGAVWLWRQSRIAPAWYAPPDPTDQTVVALAETVEYGIVENFHKLRPTRDPWTVRIRESQINAWLAARLPEWIEHDESFSWPGELSLPQVRIGPDGLELAVEVAHGDRVHVVVTRLNPRIDAGRIHLDLDRVGVGRVAVPGAPAGKMVELVERIAPGGVIGAPVAQQLVALFGRDEDGAHGAARFDLADGRRVELIALSLADGVIDLTSRTIEHSEGE